MIFVFFETGRTGIKLEDTGVREVERLLDVK